VWVGFDNPVHKLGHDGDGAHAALPLWLRAVGAAEGQRPPRPVPGVAPEGMERVVIDRESGQRAARGAGGLELWFRAGTAPTETAGQAAETPTDFGRATREF
jgi:penicillin-binding protein 1A